MIDQKALERLSYLSRVTVVDTEKEQLAKDINNIFGFINTIEKVEFLDNNQNFINQKNVVREDIIAPLSSIYDLVEAAPLNKDGFVEVPKIIGN